jgi:hypothetical protein
LGSEATPGTLSRCLCFATLWPGLLLCLGVASGRSPTLWGCRAQEGLGVASPLAFGKGMQSTRGHRFAEGEVSPRPRPSEARPGTGGETSPRRSSHPRRGGMRSKPGCFAPQRGGAPPSQRVASLPSGDGTKSRSRRCPSRSEGSEAVPMPRHSPCFAKAGPGQSPGET